MNLLKESALALMLVSVTVGGIGLLAPEGEMKRALRALCGFVLAVSLLSPLIPLKEMLSEASDADTVGERNGSEHVYAQAVRQKTTLLQEAIAAKIRSEYGIREVEVLLDVDGSDPEAIVICSAVICPGDDVSDAVKDQICAQMREMLECEVTICGTKQP